MYEDILDLIHDFQAKAHEACELLRQKFGVTGSLLGAYNRGEIPEQGELDGAGRIKYRFHGIGCCADFAGQIADFDFGPRGRCDGFDAFRLQRFAQTSSQRYDEFKDLDVVRAHLDMLKVSGVAFFPEWFPGEHLYYLTGSAPIADSPAPPRMGRGTWPMPPGQENAGR